MVFTGCMLADEIGTSFQVPYTSAAPQLIAPRSVFSVGESLEALAKLHMVLDESRDLLLTGQVPKVALRHHPFNSILDVMDRALREVRPLRGAMGEDGDRLIIEIAEARSKAERNVNLIRQLLGQHKPFKSNISRDGLVALSQQASIATAGFNA